MSDYDRDDLVADAADALTLDQRVQWDRCERLATPADRRVLGNLRAFSGILAAGRPGAGDAWPSWAGSRSEPVAGPVVRLAVNALIAFSACEVEVRAGTCAGRPVGGSVFVVRGAAAHSAEGCRIIEIVGCPPGPRDILRTDPDLG